MQGQGPQRLVKYHGLSTVVGMLRNYLLLALSHHDESHELWFGFCVKNLIKLQQVFMRMVTSLRNVAYVLKFL